MKGAEVAEATRAAAVAADVGDMAAAAGARSLIGFSKAETAMVKQSLVNFQNAGHDVSPLQQLIKAEMPPGCRGMSLSTPPTGAVLGDHAFTSQQMLDHVLEEELLHLDQNLSNRSIGPWTAAEMEAEVDAKRKIPDPHRQ